MCPYCGTNLERVPARSRLCIICKNRIYNDGNGNAITEYSYFENLYQNQKELILKKIYDGTTWAKELGIEPFTLVMANSCCHKCSKYDNKLYDTDEFIKLMPIPQKDCERANKHCCASAIVISKQKAERDGLIINTN